MSRQLKNLDMVPTLAGLSQALLPVESASGGEQLNHVTVEMHLEWSPASFWLLVLKNRRVYSMM